MVESFKYKSMLATAIGAIATIISVLGVDQLQAMFPSFGRFIPAIVALATWYISQTTENTRVNVAQEMVHEEYANSDDETENVVVNLTLDGEDIIKEDEEPVSEEETPDIIDDDGGC